MTSAFIFLILILLTGLVLFAVVIGGTHSSRGHSGARRGPLRQPPAPLSRGEITTRWATITAMAGAGGNSLRQAVAEADKLLDHVLRQQGLAGESMGDRLKSARSRFASDRATYDRLWHAHKLRNALAHEVGFDLVPSQAREALADFERALKHLGAL